MMCFFGQHEATGSRQWVEPRLSLGFQLHFAITINEKREHEERQPIRCLLVKCAQHTRSVRITRATLKQSFSFIAAIGAKVFLQQINHGPEMTTLFYVDLEQVAHVVE